MPATVRKRRTTKGTRHNRVKTSTTSKRKHQHIASARKRLTHTIQHKNRGGQIKNEKIPRIAEAVKTVINVGYTLLVHKNRYFFTRVVDDLFIFFEGVFREDEKDDIISTSYICRSEAKKLKNSCVEVKQYRFSDDPDKTETNSLQTELISDAVNTKFETYDKCGQLQKSFPVSSHGVHKDTKETKRKITFDLLEPFQLCISQTGDITSNVNEVQSVLQIDNKTENYSGEIDDILETNMQKLQPDSIAMVEYLKYLQPEQYFIYFDISKSYDELYIPGFILQTRHFENSLLKDTKAEKVETLKTDEIIKLFRLKTYGDMFRRSVHKMLGTEATAFFAMEAMRHVPGYNTIMNIIEQGVKMHTEIKNTLGEDALQQTSSLYEEFRESRNNEEVVESLCEKGLEQIYHFTEVSELLVPELSISQREIPGIVDNLPSKHKLQLASKYISDAYQFNRLLSKIFAFTDLQFVHRIISQNYLIPQCVQLSQMFAKVLIHEKFFKKDSYCRGVQPAFFTYRNAPDTEANPKKQLRLPNHKYKTNEGGDIYYYYYLSLCLYKKNRRNQSTKEKLKNSLPFTRQIYIKGALLCPSKIKIRKVGRVFEETANTPRISFLKPTYHIPQKIPNSVHNFYMITELREKLDDQAKLIEELKQNINCQTTPPTPPTLTQTTPIHSSTNPTGATHSTSTPSTIPSASGSA